MKRLAGKSAGAGGACFFHHSTKICALVRISEFKRFDLEEIFVSVSVVIFMPTGGGRWWLWSRLNFSDNSGRTLVQPWAKIGKLGNMINPAMPIATA